MWRACVRRWVTLVRRIFDLYCALVSLSIYIVVERRNSGNRGGRIFMREVLIGRVKRIKNSILSRTLHPWY